VEFVLVAALKKKKKVPVPYLLVSLGANSQGPSEYIQPVTEEKERLELTSMNFTRDFHSKTSFSNSGW
jgi:hypothetical protein